MKWVMKGLIGVLALACSVFLHPAYAQENNRRVLEEVIVTATKKETSIQDVPISITAIDNKFIQKAAIDDIRELVLFTPNVSYSTANTAKVRALGGLFADSSLDSSVGLVVDDLALTNTIFIAEPIFDLDRFEVLRGPQGTLFGKNSPAGLMNITTANPTEELSGYAVLRGGNLDAHRIEAAVGGPVGICDSCGFRLAILDDKAVDDVENTATGKAEPATQQTAARAKFVFSPTDNSDVKLSAYYGETESFHIRAQFNGGSQDTIDFMRQYDPQFETDGLNHQSSISLDMPLTRTTAIAQANYSLGLGELGPLRDAEFVAVVGYAEFDQNAPQDVDASPAELIDIPLTVNQLSQWSGEFRISGNFAGPFDIGTMDFLGGIYLFESEFNSIYDAVLGQHFDDYLATDGGYRTATGEAPPPGGPTAFAAVQAVGGTLAGGSHPFEGDGFIGTLDQEMTSYALFGQVNWSISELWGLTVGVRVAREEKDATIQNRCPGGNTCLLFGIEEYRITPNRSEDDFSPKVTLNYFPHEDLTAFLTYASGFKSGGFNNLALVPSDSEVDKETAKSIELGVKGKALDQTLSYSATVFEMNVDDQQVLNTIGVVVFIDNAASARIRGLEIDFMWLTPWAPLTIQGAAAVTDAIYTDFPNSTFGDISGENLTDVPDYQINISPDLSFQPGNLSLGLGMDLIYRGEFSNSDDPNDPLIWGDDLLVNARASIGSADDTWSLGFFVKNLLDEDRVEYEFTALTHPQSNHLGQDYQRHYTVEFRYNW